MALFHCVVRLGSVQNGTARLSSARFAFPLQFSTTLEWAGLFTCRYSCAASTAVTPEKLFNSASLHHALAGSAPRYQREDSLYFLKRQRNSHFLVGKRKVRSFQNSCVLSFAGCADLNLASLLCLVPQVQWCRQWWFSPANQWSAEFTCHVLVMVRLLGTSAEVVLNKVPGTFTQWKTPQKWAILNRTVPYHAVEKRHYFTSC